MGWYRRLVVLLLFALALSGCATASGPTSGAAPTSTARLLVRLNVGWGGGGEFGRHVADYLADGTVIRLHGSTLERNRLNESGLDKLRGLLATNADLLTTPMQIAPRSTIVPVPNNIPAGIVERVYSFILERPDGTRYAVRSPSRHAWDFLAGGHDPIVERLTALGDALADPASVFGSGAFADSWSTWQPVKTAIFLILQETTIDNDVVSDGVIPHIGPTDWPFKNDPHNFGTVYKGPGDHVTRQCAFLPSAEAATGLIGLSKQGGQKAANEMAAGLAWRVSSLLWVSGRQATFVSVQAFALLPEDGAVSCADALSN
jgi:hypothetical protein